MILVNHPFYKFQDPAGIRRRLLQHGQHPEGDAGRAGRPSVLLQGHPDQPGLCGRALQPRVRAQGD